MPSNKPPNPKDLWHGGVTRVPASIALCPECGSALEAHCDGWVSETGQPVDVSVFCLSEEAEVDDVAHRWWQSDWMSVLGAVRKWCGAVRQPGLFADAEEDA